MKINYKFRKILKNKDIKVGDSVLFNEQSYLQMNTNTNIIFNFSLIDGLVDKEVYTVESKIYNDINYIRLVNKKFNYPTSCFDKYEN